jgi:TolA-binding protein
VRQTVRGLALGPLRDADRGQIPGRPERRIADQQLHDPAPLELVRGRTLHVERAQERIDDLQERFATKEYRAALYYMRLKAFDSAILYLKDLVATYPRSSVAPDALIHLVQAYRTLGYKEDVQETCGYIRRFHAKAPGVVKACPDSAGAS